VHSALVKKEAEERELAGDDLKTRVLCHQRALYIDN